MHERNDRTEQAICSLVRVEVTSAGPNASAPHNTVSASRCSRPYALKSSPQLSLRLQKLARWMSPDRFQKYFRHLPMSTVRFGGEIESSTVPVGREGLLAAFSGSNNLILPKAPAAGLAILATLTTFCSRARDSGLPTDTELCGGV